MVERIILLADMNSFFASCHQARNPALKGKPVIVAGDPQKRHGIVLAASYEAKAYGVKTGMVNAEARSLCPTAVWVQPHFEMYVDTSHRIHEIMLGFTPRVEPFSIDEAFLDVSGCQRLWGDGETIARELKKRIRRDVGVCCSVGVGPNKLLAKMAAEMQKPDGLTVLRQQDIPERLWPLPVNELFGVGRRTARKLADMGIETIGDLAACPVEVLRRRFGVIGQVLHASANGEDHSPVDEHALDSIKSLGHQLTLPHDYWRSEDVAVVLLELADLVGARARMRRLKGRMVGLRVRGADFQGIYRTRVLPYWTDDGQQIQRAALRLFHQCWPAGEKVRLLGVTLGKLAQGVPDQLSIFQRRPEVAQLPHILDRLRQVHGDSAVMRAVSMTKASVLAGNRGKHSLIWSAQGTRLDDGQDAKGLLHAKAKKA